jgi:protein tyrosine phosphatase (PTP) superfamily phosphohydrolase (DUF442 family)
MSYPGLKGNLITSTLAAVLLLTPPAALCADSDTASSIGNYQQVTAGLRRGALPSAAGMEVLAKEGVKTIIDLRKHDAAGINTEREHARSLGLNYFHIPMGHCAPKSADVIAFLDITTNPKYQPVFVHCRQGADRTGILVALYRMLLQDWSFGDAYREMRDHQFKPWLLGMRRFLYTIALKKDAFAIDRSSVMVSLQQRRLDETAQSEEPDKKALAASPKAPGS